MRILVDQSGYDLLNIGDVAMLQSCVMRLQNLWPGAEIMVICHAPERLASYCPGTVAIGPTYATSSFMSVIPRSYRLASEQAWKMVAPYFAGRMPRRRGPGQPYTAIQAVRAADLVVASGGGYVTDTWWWHAVGVLSLLSLAQRLGKPTAMFGQGLGPISHRALHVQARTVLPKLTVLGLREDRIGRDLASSLGVPAAVVTLTGDDALELVADNGTHESQAIGLSMRVSDYAGVDPAAAAAVGDVVSQAAGAFGTSIVGLPVSRYQADGDLDAIRSLLSPADLAVNVVLDDLHTPEALVAAAAQCRVIVTGSYHAAVFGLAQGVPTICLTKSAYYDAKFAGLQALFPDACFVVSLGQRGIADWLRNTIEQAWHLPVPVRAQATAIAAGQRDAGRETYRRLRDAVGNEQVTAIANSRRSLR